MMPARVKGHKDTLTRGMYMGEEGTGYSFDELETYGDYSWATRGYLQGYTEPCEFEILVPGAEVLKTQGGERCLFPAAGERFATQYGELPGGWGLDAGEALQYGFIRVVEEEETA